MKKIVIISLFITNILTAQTKDFTETELAIPSTKIAINGTLLMPNNVKSPKLIIIIPGSGPTDRNGNQGMMQTNATKFLAEALSDKKIATFRFDKNVITLLKRKDFKEENLLFDDFIEDAKNSIAYFKKDKRFSKIVVAGHSQGSLVAILVANQSDGFISLEGAGRPIAEILYEQINNQAPFLAAPTQVVLDSLKQGQLVKNIPPLLLSVFRPSVQPFLINWMRYNPQSEIKKLSVPILLINGSKDIQVPVTDAELLHQANIKSTFIRIENMNHIFKEIKGDLQENQLSYTKPELPVMPILVETIIEFINKI
ncbi:MAG: alpha/beta hydrolase [Flavobacteriales bacterium CG_4_8_14_3_um_filter_35_10]|nr:alpha/beta hydrolase [Zetaproteobacteria bacterium]PIR14822.1 MAG: alpha/beta hydrolase [Flavobacteriales bacterium CG11_big_fil_rev_8_21_14_0_20_35_7]PIX07611.1 MAG: alpha/beta hydrolase [Flavobacteriales bacterium CG_4_8_14_3_um_filter_35_10]PJA05145.1 MAG: alpha/beta hydrolase [Flavobacteriales bacterium CG_4_10_14_0_2_um_filter_35_18]